MWVLKRWGDVRRRVLSTVLAREASEGGDGCLYARARLRFELLKLTKKRALCPDSSRWAPP